MGMIANFFKSGGMTITVTEDAFKKKSLKDQNYCLWLGVDHLRKMVRLILYAVFILFVIIIGHMGMFEVSKVIASCIKAF